MKNKISKNYKWTQDGAAVIFALLLTGLFLSIILSLSMIFIPKIRVAGDIKRSVSAVYAAESAIEWCLYVNRIASASLPVLDNGSTFINGFTGVSFISSDCTSLPIKAIGTYQGVARSFEISP